MSKLNWAKAKGRPAGRKYAWPKKTPDQKALREAHAHTRRTKRNPNTNSKADTWRIVGADYPGNTTPGIRQVWRNGSLIDET